MIENFTINVNATIDWFKVCSGIMERYNISTDEVTDLIKSNTDKYIKVELQK